jgi:integrase
VARPCRMSWVEKRNGWMKWWRGKSFAVSCKQLRKEGYDVPTDTKEGSRLAANLWWDRKEMELEAQERATRPRPLTPLEETALAVMGDQIGPEHAEAVRQELHNRGIDIRHALGPYVLDLYTALAFGRLPESLVERLAPERVRQLEAANQVIRGGEPAEPDKTVEAHAGVWLRHLQAKVKAGLMTAARCANNGTCLEHFKNYLGATSDVAGIDAKTVQGFYGHCLAQISSRRLDPARKNGWSVAYARDVFSVARAFIRWLCDGDTIPLPKNLNSRSFDFGGSGQVNKTWTVGEFQRVVTAAPGKLKLAILLMANTGMTQADVSDLLDTEVDWTAGRIRRKRSKTRGEENVPEVEYLLWPVTFELLKKYRSGKDRVLLTEGGEPYVRTRLNENGKLVKADGFASNYAHVQRRLDLHRPLKQLRKLGASQLATHKDYGRLVPYFLGHSPRTVADRHYVVPPQELLDEAVTWLGRQLGQVP